MTDAWKPEHDRPVPYRLPHRPTRVVWTSGEKTYSLPRAYIEAGLHEAAQWCADAAEEMSADWVDLYLANPEVRAQMDAFGLDDHGHWQCPAGSDHDWDDSCDCEGADS